MKVIELLDDSGVKYEVTEHKPVFTAQRMAAVEHESGRNVAKPVIVKADGRYVMCVLAACCKIDLQALKKGLGAKNVELATEDEIGGIFDDCELGAEPPFGNIYELETIVDKELTQDDHILFQAGVHNKAIKMSMADYKKVVKPKVMALSLGKA
jgi:Ala-tRNA(Pro) deacylase